MSHFEAPPKKNNATAKAKKNVFIHKKEAEETVKEDNTYADLFPAEEDRGGDNILDNLSSGFSIEYDADNPAIQQQVRWFMNRPKYLIRVINRAAPYLYYVKEQVEKRGLPIELALLPMLESAYNPFAYSTMGAAGLWQMMPGTASGYGIKQNWWYDGRRDIIASTNAALDYLAYLGRFFNNNWLLAIAAYDTGEGNILSAIRKNVKLNRNTDFWSLPLSRETRDYIPRFLALVEIIRNPERYPVLLPAINNAPYLQSVNVGSQISLQQAADLANINVGELVKLNPGYNRWATDPNGPFRLVLPIEHVDEFQINLAKLPHSQRVIWNHYRVRIGDSIVTIAKRFGITPELLRQTNHLASNQVQSGHFLLIPLSHASIINFIREANEPYIANIGKRVGPQQILHTVKAGESLSNIARQYRTNIRDIRFWNQLKASESPKLHSELVIWSKHPISHSVGYLRKRKMVYIVRKQDNLLKIARRYHTTPDMICRDNHIKNRTIHSEQRLMIVMHTGRSMAQHPVLQAKGRVHHMIYIVRQGDKLAHIAARFHTTMAKIKKDNHLNEQALHAGERLKIVV